VETLNDKKILIVRLSSIGDTIHGLPLLSAIKRYYPSARVSWLVEKPSSLLLMNNPLLEKVILFDKEKYKQNWSNPKTLNEFQQFIKNLQAEEFDLAIDLQGLFKSGILTLLSGAPRRIGFKHTRELTSFFYTEKLNAGPHASNSEHIILKNLKLASYLDIPEISVSYPLPPISEQTIEKVATLLKDLQPGLQTVTLIPATLWKSKHWQTEYWQEIINTLAGKTNIILTGTAEDQHLINTITQNLRDNQYINLAGKTILTDLIEVFRHSDLVIGPDTGPLHLAVATSKPAVIAIMGPTSAVRTGALGHTSLTSDLTCIPCNKKSCPLAAEDYMQCMKKLKPEKVLSSINEILNLDQNS
jgi:heptosyltransferase-1